MLVSKKFCILQHLTSFYQTWKMSHSKQVLVSNADETGLEIDPF